MNIIEAVLVNRGLHSEVADIRRELGFGVAPPVKPR